MTEPTRTPLPAGAATGVDSVTAIVVARNEEETIGPCLERLLWADRILVIDDGSTDRTAEIARGYTAWVVPRPSQPSIDPVHEHVNFGIAQIPAGWILQVDADERVPASLAREIRDVIASGTPHAAMRIPFRQAVLGQWVRAGYWGEQVRLIRLFRAGCARYPLRSIHEAVEIRGSTGDLRNVIYHLAVPSISSFVRKTDYYTTREVPLVLEGESPGTSALGRRAADPSGWTIFWTPVRLFLWSYVKRKGWRDGRLGVATSLMFGFYGFIEMLKVWERATHRHGPVPVPEDERE